MADDGEEIVTFRLAPKDRAAIQRLVDSGEFRNRSDFLRYAVKATLAEYEPGARARLNLDIEGVELPAQGAGRGRPRAARAGKGVNI